MNLALLIFNKRTNFFDMLMHDIFLAADPDYQHAKLIYKLATAIELGIYDKTNNHFLKRDFEA